MELKSRMKGRHDVAGLEPESHPEAVNEAITANPMAFLFIKFEPNGKSLATAKPLTADPCSALGA